MFRLIKILNGRTNQSEPVKLKTTAGTAYGFGAALSLASGALVNCTATTKPLYICGEDAAANEKEEITVYPVDANQIFEVPVSASPASLTVGAKVTLNVINSMATGVSATTTNGVAEIFDLNSAVNAGDKILVRIV